MGFLPPKKSLGQHFLIEPAIHKRIVDAMAPSSEDIAIEIGPGTGLLTQHLLATPLKKLISFELDARAVPDLQKKFEKEEKRFLVEQQDFLAADLAVIASHERQKLRMVGNIPYYITSPIIFKLLDERASLIDAHLLVQLEVAQRLVGEPGTKAYGIPTVLANFFAEVKFLFRVPAGAFRPVPKVDSAVIRIDFLHDYFDRTKTERPQNFDDQTFRQLVRALFAMRRKTIRNNLKATVSPLIMEKIGTGPLSGFLSARAEELEIPDFLRLYSEIEWMKIGSE